MRYLLVLALLADPYRWLETPNARTAAWVKARDADARAALDRLPGRDELRSAIAAAAAAEVTLPPTRRGARLFFFRVDASFTRATLFVTEEGRTRLLADGDVVPSAWPSPDGASVAVCRGAATSDRCD